MLSSVAPSTMSSSSAGSVTPNGGLGICGATTPAPGSASGKRKDGQSGAGLLRSYDPVTCSRLRLSFDFAPSNAIIRRSASRRLSATSPVV